MKNSSRGRIILFSSVLLIGSLLISIVLSEIILRYYFKAHPAYETEAVRIKMSYTKLRPDTGFLWKENLNVSANANPEWRDQEKYPLITDEFGFLNPPDAISMRRDRRPIDIIGLGDSFIHESAFLFSDLFRRKGLFFL